MLREKILDLFRDCEPDIQGVLADIIEVEWAKLSYDKPRGVIEQIRQIIDDEARKVEHET